MFTFQYFKIPQTLSRNYCDQCLKALEKVVKKSQKGVIHLIVISSEEMASLNEQFRGKTGPTDILTFSYRKSSENVWINFFSTQNSKLKTQNFEIAGEIYLCLEKIKLYAKERWHTYREELEYIVIHGLVHLMGYDHESDRDEEEMENIEKKIQSEIKKIPN